MIELALRPCLILSMGQKKTRSTQGPHCHRSALSCLDKYDKGAGAEITNDTPGQEQPEYEVEDVDKPDDPVEVDVDVDTDDTRFQSIRSLVDDLKTIRDLLEN